MEIVDQFLIGFSGAKIDRSSLKLLIEKPYSPSTLKVHDDLKVLISAILPGLLRRPIGVADVLL